MARYKPLRVKMVWSGITEAALALRAAPRSARAGAAQRVNEVLEKIFEESQILVPEDTGTLAASGKIQRVRLASLKAGFARERFHAGISYGDDRLNPKTKRPSKAYAVFQHETFNNKAVKTGAHTPYGGSLGQAKYLETPFRKHSNELAQAVRQGYRSGLRIALAHAQTGRGVLRVW